MSKAVTKEPKRSGAGVAKSSRADGGAKPLLTRRQRRRLAWVGAVSAVALVVGAGGWYYLKLQPRPGEFVPSLGNAHIATADTPHQAYNSDPPTSGPHLPYIAPWGLHARPIPKELQVHNLEDGGVVVNYREDCAGRVLEPLKALTGRYAERVILAPYPGLDRCIALTAWTRVDRLDAVDERRIVRFIEAYRGIDHHPR